MNDMAKKYNHVHKYERRKFGSWKSTGYDVYKCAVPGCAHYMADLEAVVGRYSKCWGLIGIVPGTFDIEECPHLVEMTRYIVFSEKRKHPLCNTCKLRKKIAKMSPEEREEYEQTQATIERLISPERYLKLPEEDEELQEYDEQ